MYIECPPMPENIKKASAFEVKITADLLAVGVKGNPPYLKHAFKGVADSGESVWFF